MPSLPESAIVRLKSQEGSPVGIGFLVSDTLILTCAHVAAQALYGAEWEARACAAEKPRETLTLDFPLIVPTLAVTASVAVWHPMSLQGGAASDIAVLHLAEPRPSGSEIAPLYR